jgi:phage baseplate assembly protein V
MMRALSNLFGKGSVSLVDDSGDVQMLQVTEGAQGTGAVDRIVDRVPRVAEFGFASVPPLGSLATMLRRTADRARGVVIGTHHAASRPKGLQPGDTVMHDVRGARVQLTADGLLIDCAGLPARVRGFSSLTVDGDLHVTGDVISRSGGAAVSLNGVRDAYVAHKHIGVVAGSGISGLTDHTA